MTAREWSRDQAGEPAYFRALRAHVAKLRKAQGLTQAELARLPGISQQTVFACELGHRRISVLMLVKLAKVFGVPVEVLMGLTNSPPPANPRPSPAGIRHAERFQQISKNRTALRHQNHRRLARPQKQPSGKGRSDPKPSETKSTNR